MNGRARYLWISAKWLIAAFIIGAVGLHLADNLRRLDLGELRLRPSWLALSAALYLAGLGFSGLFWYRLLWAFGERPGLFAAARAYYVSQLGKYIPGKAVALLLRGSLIASPRAKFGVGIISAAYEVLTTMASGALLAAALFVLQPPAAVGLKWNPVWLGGALLLLVGVPLLPGVFNFAVAGLARRFQRVESFRLPRLRPSTLLLGLGLTGVNWVLLTLSFWALLQAILPGWQTLTPAALGRYTAMVSLAYVAGFLAIVVPGGLGVREGILGGLLPAELAASAGGPSQAAAVTAVAVILLRLVWTLAELAAAAALYWWPGARRPPLLAGGAENLGLGEPITAHEQRD